jgi:hypothetical protein
VLPAGTAVKLLWPAVKIRRFGALVAVIADPKPALAEPRPLPQKASQQPCHVERATPESHIPCLAGAAHAGGARAGRVRQPRAALHNNNVGEQLGAHRGGGAACWAEREPVGVTLLLMRQSTRMIE